MNTDLIDNKGLVSKHDRMNVKLGYISEANAESLVSTLCLEEHRHTKFVASASSIRALGNYRGALGLSATEVGKIENNCSLLSESTRFSLTTSLTSVKIPHRHVSIFHYQNTMPCNHAEMFTNPIVFIGIFIITYRLPLLEKPGFSPARPWFVVKKLIPHSNTSIFDATNVMLIPQ